MGDASESRARWFESRAAEWRASGDLKVATEYERIAREIRTHPGQTIYWYHHPEECVKPHYLDPAPCPDCGYPGDPSGVPTDPPEEGNDGA